MKDTRQEQRNDTGHKEGLFSSKAAHEHRDKPTQSSYGVKDVVSTVYTPELHASFILRLGFLLHSCSCPRSGSAATEEECGSLPVSPLVRYPDAAAGYYTPLPPLEVTHVPAA
jgi:hypothetical protein